MYAITALGETYRLRDDLLAIALWTTMQDRASSSRVFVRIQRPVIEIQFLAVLPYQHRGPEAYHNRRPPSKPRCSDSITLAISISIRDSLSTYSRRRIETGKVD
jgi:hypothetical protein